MNGISCIGQYRARAHSCAEKSIEQLTQRAHESRRACWTACIAFCFLFPWLLAHFLRIRCCCLTHRDLKAANILFDQAGRPKVCDFGLSEERSKIDLTRVFCGQLKFAHLGTGISECLDMGLVAMCR
jgi:serine/threonine protein kinase